MYDAKGKSLKLKESMQRQGHTINTVSVALSATELLMLQLSSTAQKEKFSANTVMLSTLVIVQSQNTKAGMIPRLSWERRVRWTRVLAATEKFLKQRNVLLKLVPSILTVSPALSVQGNWTQ